MNRKPEYPTEYSRLRYVVDALWREERISQSQLSYAAGFSRTEIGTVLKRLERGENISHSKWMTLFDLLGPELEWWTRGRGNPQFEPSRCADEIRRRAASAKTIADERRANTTEDDQAPARNVLQITKRLKKRAK